MLGLLPCPQPTAPWDIITAHLFNRLKDHEIFWSNYRGGVALTPRNSFLFDLDDKTIGNVIGVDELESMLLLEDIPVVGLNGKIFKTITENTDSGGKRICSF